MICDDRAFKKKSRFSETLVREDAELVLLVVPVREADDNGLAAEVEVLPDAEEVWDASLACIWVNNWLRLSPAELPICMLISKKWLAENSQQVQGQNNQINNILF